MSLNIALAKSPNETFTYEVKRTVPMHLVRTMMSDYQSGMSCAEIGVKHGLSTKAVYDQLRNRVVMRKPSKKEK